jgi:CCR4-NOT transcriptional regulation complex NOT5 subunit
LVQRYGSILIEHRNNDDALYCIVQLKIENAMLKSQADLLNLGNLALNEKYDMLSCSHDNLVDSHVMLNISHEVVIDSLNSCEPYSCSCVKVDNILSCANPCYSKKGKSLIE